MGHYLSKFCPCVKDKGNRDEETNSEMIELKENENTYQKIDLNIKIENKNTKYCNNDNTFDESNNLLMKQDNNMIEGDKDIINKKKRDNNNYKKKSEQIINNEKKDDNIISLGINIGALKTVYSIFSKINDKHVTNVLLMNNSSRAIPSIICYTKDHILFGENSISSFKTKYKYFI